jgi:hypothetical protein
LAILNVNGTDIPDPSKLEVTVSEILSKGSARNAAGEMLRDRIAEKVKLTCSWNWLSNSDCAQLLTAIDPVYFSMTYPDPMAGSNLTKTMYAGDRKAPVYWVQNGVPGWRGVAMDFIEK